MRSLALTLAVVTTAVAVEFANILDYGGDPTGNSYNNAAVDNALAALKDARAGTLYFPPGQYLLTPQNFSETDSLTVLLDGAELLASPKIPDWRLIAVLPSYGTGRDFAPSPARYDSFFHVWNSTNFTLTSNSSGVVNGNGAVWWKAKFTPPPKGLNYTPGHLVETMYCDGVTLENVLFKDSPFWTTHLYASSNLVLRNLTIRANETNGYNTDGIDVDSSRNVLIEDCDIRTGDDGVVFKSGWDEPGQRFGMPTVNVTVRNLVGQAPKGCCACVGSETSGGIADITVQNSTCLGGSRFAYGVKTATCRGAYIRNVSFVDCTLTSGNFSQYGIWTSTAYGDPNPVGSNASATPIITDISFRNVRVAAGDKISGGAGQFQGPTTLPITGIELTDVVLTGAQGWQCNDGVQGSSQNVQPPPCSQLGG